MAEWTWAIGPGASTESPRPERELASATGRNLTRRLAAASTAQFTLDARSDEALSIVDKVTDLWVWRDGVQLFRGRITVPDDTVAETSHTATYTATCYRGMLAFRTIGDTDLEITADQAQIAWSLIAATQARTGGNWGITAGLIPAGTPRTRNYPAGKSIADAIAEIADAEGGFEWEISPELTFNVWSPARGAAGVVHLDLTGRVAGVRTTGDPARFGNVIIAIGSQETTPVVAEAAGLATDPRGRWELVDVSPTVVLQPTLAERAPARLTEALADGATLTARLALPRIDDDGRRTPGWDGPSDLWLGDPVLLTVNSGRLGQFDTRVTELNLVPGDNDDETVTVGLTASTRTTPEARAAAQRNEIRRRIRALELAAARPAP